MKNLATFQPKTKKDFQEFANLICNRMYEFSGSTHFNYLLEQTVRQLADRQDFNNYQSVKNMGSTIGTIGNQKMQEWKNSNKKGGKKKSKGISLGGQGKAYSDMQNLEDFDDDGDDDDFM